MFPTQELITTAELRLGLFKTMWPKGNQKSKRLWEWIMPVHEPDLLEWCKKRAYILEKLLGRCSIDFSNPLAVRNFVSRWYRYEPDKQENWPLPYGTMESGIGDCEDLAMLVCSILYSQGVPGVRLIVGRIGDQQEGVNHCWGMLFPIDGSGPFVLESTGGDEVDHLPTLNELTIHKYHPLVMAERNFWDGESEGEPGGRLWLCNEWINS